MQIAGFLINEIAKYFFFSHYLKVPSPKAKLFSLGFQNQSFGAIDFGSASTHCGNTDLISVSLIRLID